MKKSFWVPLAVALAIALGVPLLEGMNGFLYLDASAFAITFGTAAVLVFASFGASEIGRAFGAAFGEADRAELRKAAAFFSSAGREIWLSAGAGAIAGTVMVLSRLGEPERIGVSLALGLLSLLYAVLLNLFLIMPFKAAIEKKLAELG